MGREPKKPSRYGVSAVLPRRPTLVRELLEMAGLARSVAYGVPEDMVLCFVL